MTLIFVTSGTIFLEIQIMTLEEALDLALNEAESSALGDGNEEVMEAIKLLRCFYDEYGFQFCNYENDFHLPV